MGDDTSAPPGSVAGETGVPNSAGNERVSAASRELLVVIPTERLWMADYFSGFTRAVGAYLGIILDPTARRILRRREAEADPSHNQIICYVVFRHGSRVFSYRRGARVNERRLSGRRSVGIGGHVNRGDLMAAGTTGDWLGAAVRRELAEEVELASSARATRGLDPGDWFGAINTDDSAVGRVHFGLVRVVDLAEPRLRLRDDRLEPEGFASIDELLATAEEFEGWSVYCLKALASECVNRPATS